MSEASPKRGGVVDVAHATVLITGASKGLGRFLARFFAHRGAEVVATARTEPALRELAGEIVAAGGKCTFRASDLCDPESLVSLVDEVREHQGGVDVLINNAADVMSKPLLDSSLEEIDRVVRTNVTGALQLSRLVAPLMVARGQGMIVNISSLAGYKANPSQTVYSVSKSAVNGMSEALRAELGGSGIRVMNVALSSVGTETDTRPGQVPVAAFAHALEKAMAKGQDELYLSVVTKWLMRLYKFFPPLARLR